MHRLSLHEAAARDDTEALANSGGDVNARDAAGQTALHVAAARNCRQAVDWLVRAEAEIDAADDHGMTPLHLAAANGCADVLDQLCSYGAEINRPDAAGDTPLHLAARRNRGFAARRLLLFGANPALQNARLETPRQAAVNASVIVAVRAIDSHNSLKRRSWRWRMALRAAGVNTAHQARLLRQAADDLWRRALMLRPSRLLR
jgi:ankyrin repeat protein